METCAGRRCFPFRGQQQALAAVAGKQLRKQPVGLALDPAGVGEGQGMAARPRRRGQRHRREYAARHSTHARNWPVIQLHIAQVSLSELKMMVAVAVRTWSVTASTPAKLRAAISGTMSMR